MYNARQYDRQPTRRNALARRHKQDAERLVECFIFERLSYTCF